MELKSLSAVSAGVSLRVFARLDGCDDRLVRRAIARGSLIANDDGSLDPALAGTGWRKSNRRADSPKVSADKPKVSADIPLDNLDPEIVAKLSAGNVSLALADQVKANALALKHLLAARKSAGELVEAELAEQVLFDQARTARDAWSNWPTRVGPLIAADLGLAPEAVVESLTVHVHQHLAELGEPGAAFPG
jgi:hypothetical protein